jgi:hypothetical protein
MTGPEAMPNILAINERRTVLGHLTLLAIGVRQACIEP